MQRFSIRIFLTSVLYILTILGLNAQSSNQFLEKIEIKNGLSSNYPTSLIEDSNGFIWIGTNNGLNRYDGYKPKVFKYDPKDSNTISENWITSLLEDSNGDIWIGTEGGGLNLYNTTTGAITRFIHKKNDSTTISSDVVNRIYEDSKSRIWISTKNGLNLLDRSKQTFQHWIQPKECKNCDYSIKAVAEDDKGNLWVGDEFQGLYYFIPSSGKFTKTTLSDSNENALPSEFINDLYYSKGMLWVGTDNGLAILNTRTEPFKKVLLDENDKNSIGEMCIWKIYNDNDGSIWLSTNGSGLINYNLKTHDIKIYKSDGISAYKIGSNSIEDVIVDKSKNIWMATTGNGLNKFDLKNLNFSSWEKDNNNSNSLVNNGVRAMLQDLDGTIWIGTNNGLSRFNPKSNQYRNYVKDFSYRGDVKISRIRAIHRSKNNKIWIGTQSGGLYRYDPKQDKFILEVGFTNNTLASRIGHIQSIYETEDDILLIGTIGAGMVTYNTITNEIKSVYTKDNPNKILTSLTAYCVLKSSNSEIWIGSDRGLILLNTNTFEFKLWEHKEACENCIVGNKVRSLYRDNNNKIWIGTRSGLAIFDPESEKFEQYRIDDGLPSDIIFGILPGSDGNIWLTTPNGLSQTNPLNMQFKNITIPGNNILDMGGHSLGLNGNLLVGGTSGFTIFNPKDIKSNPYIPNVVFTDVKVNNAPIEFDKNISELNYINLPYDQNNLNFEFSALEFTNSQINTYKYKLEGFNDNWVEYGSKHDLTFTNLDPKTYVLKIKGSNNEGVWNEQETSLTIIIKPPFWKTLWFRILSILLIIGILFTIYYLRIKRLKNTEVMLQKEVSKQTKELVENNKKLEELHREKDGIIGIIAHDLRGPLNNIQGLSQLLESNENLDEKQKTYLSYINKSIKSGNSLITDLLIMSNVNHPEKTIELKDIELSDFIEEWEKSYIKRLEKKDQELRTFIDKKPLILHTDQKLVTRIFDNLMTNAIKFSNKGSKIDLSVNSNNDSIFISFKDYGPGISEADRKKAFKMFQKLTARPTDGESSHGLGLAIVKTLAEKLKGSIKIKSELGQGTEFIINLPKISKSSQLRP
ncbi:GHKL domain-containing protein [Cellulophaga sp. HaHaR_3_176]|uniref:ligand-binding sensor domain-containing protein n=1 Tax=Cellulophaga sp. HaHaR_3_176 TaxID=1942464 RepID=UPI001C1FDC55|nr:sensor histidine kinase [Cellulophaga sp. HaHaR_3_176]QWX83006.1 GHKL domain-containing protein [Cellulophaga sp. HaHaR_3_176]